MPRRLANASSVNVSTVVSSSTLANADGDSARRHSFQETSAAGDPELDASRYMGDISPLLLAEKAFSGHVRKLRESRASVHDTKGRLRQSVSDLGTLIDGAFSPDFLSLAFSKLDSALRDFQGAVDDSNVLGWNTIESSYPVIIAQSEHIVNMRRSLPMPSSSTTGSLTRAKGSALQEPVMVSEVVHSEQTPQQRQPISEGPSCRRRAGCIPTLCGQTASYDGSTQVGRCMPTDRNVPYQRSGLKELERSPNVSKE